MYIYIYIFFFFFKSSFIDATKILNDFVELKDKYKSSTNSEEFNKDALKVLLEYRVVDVKSVDKLVERNKIKINDIEEILNDYR